MKIKFRMILAVIMVLCLAGCGSPKAEEPETKKSKAEEPTEALSGEGTIGDFGYLFSDGMNYDGNFRTRGYYVLTYNENSYFAYVICSGEHSTGGYDISVSNLELDAEGNLVVTVKETSPRPDAMVTQAFTYPRLTLMISKPADSDKRIIVQTPGGSEFPFLGNLEDKDEETGFASGDDKASSKETLDVDLGEIYSKDPSMDDVVTASNGTRYVKNQILISAEMDCTRDKIEKLGKEYGFEIVGYIEITQDYQIEFTRDVEEAELLELMKTFEKEDYISSCWLNTVSEIVFD